MTSPRSDLERRALMQQIITHPDAIADLLLHLMDRVEALEWGKGTSTYAVRNAVDNFLHANLTVDPVAHARREHT